MYDKKLAIALTAKDTTGRAFDTLQGRITGITKKVFSLQGAFVATAAAAGMGYFIKKSLDAADAIGKTADRIGVTTDALQEYRHAAELSGIQQSTMDKGLEAFTKRLGEARAGTGALVTYLNSYNETLLENVQTAGSTEKALKLIFGAMENMTSASDKAALSAAAFSRTAGVQMVNMMREGTDGLNSMLQEARDLGLVIDESLVRESEKANDALTKVNSIIKTQLTATIVELAPTITNVADQMSSWVKANRDLIDSKIKGAIEGIRDSISGIVEVYNAVPKDVVAAGGAGIIGAILFGGPTGVVVATLTLINKQLDTFDMNIGSILAKSKSLGENLKNLWDVFRGKKDWQTGAALEGFFQGGSAGEMSGAGGGFAPETPTPDMSALTGGVTQEAMETALGNSREYFEQMKEQLFSFHDVALEEAQARQAEEMEYEAGHFERMLENLGAYHDGRLAIMSAKQAQELELEIQLKKMRGQVASNWLQTTMNVGNAVLAFSGKQSKAIFAIAKAAEVAKATMAAFTASNMAMASPPGPPWTLPLAASVLAMGLANAAAIGATAIGTMKGGGAAGGAVGTYSASPATGFPVIPGGETETKGSLTINIQGDLIGDEGYIEMLAEKISAAVEDRDVTLVASNARTAEQVI